MNLCFLIGKIISDIDFRFIINSKNISIAIFELQLSNKSIVKVKAYNETADYCCRELIINDMVSIQGELSNNTEIIINDIELI